MNEEGKSYLEHLEELRKRIIWILIILCIAMVGGLLMAEPVITYLKAQPPAADIEWNVFSPWDSIRIYMNVALLFGVLITLPFTMYQIWSFVKPGMTQTEQKASIYYIPGTILLFAVGLSFAYYVVFPMAFFFTSTITKSLNFTETYGISQYFSFMFNILIPVSILFEVPVVVMFLTKIRVLNPKILHKFRRYAYIILVIVSTLITPPDAISAIIVAIPLIILYEFSVLLSRNVYKKQLEAQELMSESSAET